MHDLFQEIIEFPDPNSDKNFVSLVGIEQTKTELLKESSVILIPTLLDDWSSQNYGEVIPLVKAFRNRPPLFIFAGDVGTGKTSLAESFGSVVSRKHDIPITLYRLSLKTRGRGTVGEMTHLISSAFEKIKAETQKGISSQNKPKSSIVFVIDEADALAQSRELSQMHHEDRAGVNSLIRGIDALTNELPVLVIMCTNRLAAIDPAIQRRASRIFKFNRPNNDQRVALLKNKLEKTNLSDEEISKLALMIGDKPDRNYGFTYSDITHRFLPALLLSSFPDNPIIFSNAIKLAKEMEPTPPFKELSAN